MKKKTSYILFSTTILLMNQLSPLAPIRGIADTFNVQDTRVISGARTVHIDGADFAQNFINNGNASIIGDIGTLTNDTQNQVGNAILNTKIDMSQSFQLSGKVNLGNKSQKNGGADGMSFVLQPGDTSVVGSSGGAMGFGGISGAFGFKLDTFFNATGGNGYSPDPAQFGPDHGKGVAFGAFVDGTSGVANTINEGAKQISEPDNNAFKPFSINYDGTSKLLTVNYDGQIWTQDITSLLGNEKSMSFAISASTGSHTNLQQFQLEGFDYTVAQGQVVSHYIDEAGNTLSDDVIQSGDLDTPWATEQKEIPGYKFKEVQGKTSGKYTADNQVVTYIYEQSQGLADVRYIDDILNETLATVELGGNVGAKAGYSTADRIKYYEDRGYELVSDNYPKDDITFSEVPQHYQVHLQHKVTPVNPENPQEPDTPINPNDPNSPVWPDGTDKSSLTKLINETVHYVYKDGSMAAQDVNDQVIFNHEIIIDNVTGEMIQDNGWTTLKNYFDEKGSPEIKGYIPDKKIINKVSDLTQDSKDIVETVVYSKEKNPVKPVNPVDPVDPVNPVNPVNSVTTPITSQNPISMGIGTNDKLVGSLPETGEKLNMLLGLFGSLAVVGAAVVLVLKKR